MENHLSIEELNEILPAEEKIDLKVPRRQYIIYTKVKGEPLPVAMAKIVKNTFLFNIVTDYYNSIGCKHICLVLGREGALLMPIEILTEYNKYSGWKLKSTKGKQYWIRGTIRNGGIKLVCSVDHTKDVVADKYFFQYETK